LIAALLAACGAVAQTPVPTSLPTAIPPEGGVGEWAVSFMQEFPSGFWTEGFHRYGFHLNCPIRVGDDGDLGTEWREFQVTEEVQPQVAETVAYLRLNGVSRAPFAPAYEQQVIHPQQPTTAIIHLVGLSLDDAKKAQSECEALFAWDRGLIQALVAVEPFRP
jgi:hypothetical protein